MIELAAVSREVLTKTQYRGEMCLHITNALANRHLAADYGLEVLRATQVIGVCVGFKNPLQRQVI